MAEQEKGGMLGHMLVAMGMPNVVVGIMLKGS
jgi:hypothetical protein